MQTQAVQNVSPTLGNDSLHAAIIAGIIGVGLVLLFMILYYRLLAHRRHRRRARRRARCSTASSRCCRRRNGLALSLAGIAGVIVSVGVTVDSYVVFFERLKDEIRSGRSMRNSAQRGFTAAWRTILMADLGVADRRRRALVPHGRFGARLRVLPRPVDVIDLVVAYFFTRPAVLLLARTKWMARRKVMGIEVGPDHPSRGPAAAEAVDRRRSGIELHDRRAVRRASIEPTTANCRRSVWGRLYHGETSIDFYGQAVVGPRHLVRADRRHHRSR